jgi:methylisocitrate lyase
MVDRIKAAVSGRTDPEFVIMARTDALASEGLEAAIARAKAYIDAGADMLFPEACRTLEDYRAFQTALSVPNFHKDVPILANITEFGQTPLFTTEELGKAGVSMVLYPLSAFRAMVSNSAQQQHTCVRTACAAYIPR